MGEDQLSTGEPVDPKLSTLDTRPPRVSSCGTIIARENRPSPGVFQVAPPYTRTTRKTLHFILTIHTHPPVH